VATDSAQEGPSSFFGKLRQRLNKGKSWLSGNIGSLLEQPLDDDTLEELEEQLILADVGVEAAAWVTDELRKRSKTKDASPKQQLRTAVANLLEPLAEPLVIDRGKQPFIILVLGVNGAGKTTSIGKLAQHFQQRGFSTLLAAGDTFRAAAVEQLQEWGKRVNAPVITQAPGADPAAVIFDALGAARARDIDIVIADTAGRLHTAAGLMDELDKIKRVIGRFDSSAPHETLLVLDASQGQNALVQARQFHAKVGLTGLALTKLDGSAKGGIALAIAKAMPMPIRFIGVGEGVDDFNVFDADEFAAALIGADEPDTQS
jgi:fused signal recognition particle receptor